MGLNRSYDLFFYNILNIDDLWLGVACILGVFMGVFLYWLCEGEFLTEESVFSSGFYSGIGKKGVYGYGSPLII